MLKKTLFIIFLYLSLFNIAQAEEQGTLTVGTNYSLFSLDPYSQINQESLQLSNLLFDSLTRWENFTVENHLLKDLKKIDNLKWRATLRENLFFHSGRPVTTEEIIWSFKRAKMSPNFSYIFANIKEIKAVDSLTMEFTTIYPTILMPQRLTYLFVMDKDFYQGTDEYGIPKDKVVSSLNVQPTMNPFPFAWTHVSGSGPFTLYKFTPNNRLELKNFDKYWKKRGNIKNLIITKNTKAAKPTVSLISDKVDCILQIPPLDAFRISGVPNINLYSTLNSKIFIIQFNFDKNNELKNPKVREAIISATDSQAIAKDIFFDEKLATQQFAISTQLGHLENLDPRYNLKKAHQLMQELGYNTNKPLELTMVVLESLDKNQKSIVSSFVSMMQLINIHITIVPLSEIEYFNARKLKSDADLLFTSWKPDTEDSSDYFQHLLMCKDKNNPSRGDFNFGKYCNHELDQLINHAMNTENQEKRKELLQEATQIAYNDMAFIPIVYAPFIWSTNKDVLNAEDIVNRSNIIYFGKVLLKIAD
ncbi:ABC transporter substrate-binding protein [Desulfovibrio litoralis]|uniref:Peptide/nickel transport system substrate-binding protein n=1 Tax=Desulfovibrio litoralis DSM 11393 TaxID=1121455 RepID=A0A1M7S867_9BACT|nr:ABC transporter substrate-binding protein [Desulfovibrio litoralis]SHN54522.1 peptide/nickel transport system substrate-binding protein [Desulfovibrio litoralis DSM 11393]